MVLFVVSSHQVSFEVVALTSGPRKIEPAVVVPVAP